MHLSSSCTCTLHHSMFTPMQRVSQNTSAYAKDQPKHICVCKAVAKSASQTALSTPYAGAQASRCSEVKYQYSIQLLGQKQAKLTRFIPIKAAVNIAATQPVPNHS